jgi:tripartite-type tricarboxylate transporter receptor subunit TctC
VVASADLRERLAVLGVEPAGKSAEQMAAYLKSEIDKYGKIVRAIGLKIQ